MAERSSGVGVVFFLDNIIGFCYTTLNSFCQVTRRYNDPQVLEGKDLCDYNPGGSGRFYVWLCGRFQGSKSQMPEMRGDFYDPGRPGSVSDGKPLIFFRIDRIKVLL